jgi:amino acid transporter
MPENGGNVVWVQEAFGDFLGFINAYNNLASSISSLALLVVIFASYIPFGTATLLSISHIKHLLHGKNGSLDLDS